MNDVVVPCPSCRTLNRFAAARVASVPTCASCRGRLLGEPVALDTASFERVARTTTLPLVLDFWAAWCGPCNAMAPHFAAVARELAGTAVLAKVDTEAEPDLAARFAIRSLPTLVLSHGGRELRRISGALDRGQLLRWIQQG